MSNPYERVREFHKAMSQPVLEVPQIPDEDRVELRKKLIKEEWQELQDAIEEKDMLKIAKEWADLEYVVNGFALEFGIPQSAFTEVHYSNMSKLGPDGKVRYREDGKVLKPESYFEPDMEWALYGEHSGD